VLLGGVYWCVVSLMIGKGKGKERKKERKRKKEKEMVLKYCLVSLQLHSGCGAVHAVVD